MIKEEAMMKERLKNYKVIVFGLMILIGVTACGGGESKKQITHKSGRLISSELLKSYSNDTINIPDVDAKYPIKVYRVLYETKNVDGSFVDASGLLAIPQKAAQAKSPSLIFHHGTIYDNRHAPTESIVNTSSSVLAAYIGFIVMAPDYIGYGESLGTMHPYLIDKVTASTSVDLLRASQTFLKEQNIASNHQLFLGGYSQGGSATISTQKLIETELSDEFSVTATSAGAGSYALSDELLKTSQEMLDDYETYLVKRPHNLGLILKALDSAYGLNILDRIFQKEYATVVDTIYDGSHNSKYIDSKLTAHANKLIKKDFLQNIVDGKEQTLVNAFKDNDLFDWAPKSPTSLYQGRDDDWVAFSHAQKAYDTMISNGAVDLQLVECKVANNKPTNHANCFGPYLLTTYKFFLQYATDL